MSRMRSTFALLMVVCVGLAAGQDQNWGKKVKCFVIQDSVVCPGCNSRAGLFCPRRAEDGTEFEICASPSSALPLSTRADVTTTEATTTTEVTMEPSEITSNHLLLYLYRYLGPRYPPKSRNNRATKDEDKEECRWNGDCPCPMICCRRGSGCPMRCVMGIRRHPHVGYG